MPVPITRTLRLSAVQKDAATLSAVESIGGRRVYKFRASDGDFDRYSDRLSVKGWRVDGYNANGVVLFNHDDGAEAASAGAEPQLPIGKGRVYVEGDALMVDVEFDDEDEFAKRVERKVAKGILNAVSVRYLMLPGQYRQNERGGYDCDAQELLEVSIVTIPGNARAVRAKSFEDEGEDVVERIAARVVELLDARAEAKSTDDEEPETEEAAEPASETEVPPAESPKADEEEDDKAKGFNASDAAKSFVEAFKGYIRGV
ncbi:primosomal replication protein N [Myxococcus llanfairpwllgwyngyllgogerychwyrndrobwllllantysiliogogogochensis]|uniref:Primosomal replication protein N n=1 Tax=Myxococcus llanfairpwllgwyngyllgogerychwyrndrobwllllantysiliogogogochensis TaxID=2590453 RepID=A0A540WXJ8_9BACT|nr:HK97 family phage prohead protease [Myxococcus llanfairpwllgwyngyllgogerychwyrndrobwllllantysiliogogogochensis]TQF13729.1 primosomal replication protein N [Myxococcus llanfairpwllgwyngyllgogerychwyrndrobwllllantysiliogogogochensis]